MLRTPWAGLTLAGRLGHRAGAVETGGGRGRVPASSQELNRVPQKGTCWSPSPSPSAGSLCGDAVFTEVTRLG